jgi:hypothetical protein
MQFLVFYLLLLICAIFSTEQADENGCQICMEEYDGKLTKPFTLHNRNGVNHTYCENCIKMMIREDGIFSIEIRIQCPTCRDHLILTTQQSNKLFPKTLSIYLKRYELGSFRGILTNSLFIVCIFYPSDYILATAGFMTGYIIRKTERKRHFLKLIILLFIFWFKFMFQQHEQRLWFQFAKSMPLPGIDEVLLFQWYHFVGNFYADPDFPKWKKLLVACFIIYHGILLTAFLFYTEGES